MAPKYQRKRSDDPITDEEPGKKEHTYDLGDTPSLKRALDDVVVQTIEAAGYPIDHTYTDVRIVLGLLACAMACLAQFYPGKYPANASLLAGCVAAYVVLSIAMSALATLAERDAIALTHAKPGGGGRALRATARLPRYQDIYTLRLDNRSVAAAWRWPARPAAGGLVLQRSVASYFRRDGSLAAEVVREDVAALLQQFEGEGDKTK